MNNTTAIIGFDSAWADNAPGAICALVASSAGVVDFKPPELVHFDEALAFIEKEGGLYDLCLIAVDQPTIVPNMIGCRPVDRVAASVISFIGGGVQPANRSRQGLFDDDAPFWRFKSRVNAREDPEQSRSAVSGRFIIEVFPALALATFNSDFFGRLTGPKYNPANKRKFRPDDWIAVVETVGRHAQLDGIIGIEAWAKEFAPQGRPRSTRRSSMRSRRLSVANEAARKLNHGRRSNFWLHDCANQLGHEREASEGRGKAQCGVRLTRKRSLLTA